MSNTKIIAVFGNHKRLISLTPKAIFVLRSTKLFTIGELLETNTGNAAYWKMYKNQ